MNNPHDIPQSWKDLDALLGEMREASADLARKKAKRDAAVAEVAQEHAPTIERHEGHLSSLEHKANAFLAAHRAEFPAPGEEGRFRDLIHGRVGFRQSAPKLCTLREMTEDEVVEFMVSNKRRFDRYLRTKISLDKSTILAEMPKDVLEEVGLAVEQQDNYFVTLKKG